MRKRSSDESKLSQPPAARTLAQLDEARAQLFRTRSEAEATIKQLRQDKREREAELDALLALSGSRDTRVRPIEQLKRTGRLPEATYIMMASDWHVGERVRKSETGGLNEYSPDIAAERAHQYFRSNLTMLQAARSAWNVNQLVWWWGGDFMTGHIHEEYKSENFLHPTQEMELAHDLLLEGMRFILARYDVERVLVVTSNGNHGRTLEKKVIAGAFLKSYEWLMYRFLRKALEGESRVQVQLGEGYENHLSVYGFRIRWHHGDEVQYNGGVGGIYPALYRRIHRTNSGPNSADLDCFGHHHTLGFGPRGFGNGSLIGPTAFSVSKGFPPERPLQGSFIIDAKHRVPSNMNPIIVERSTSK